MSPAAVAWHAAEGIFQICADTWTVAFVLLVLLVLAARTAARIRQRRKSAIGDDVVRIFCRHCEGEWVYRCTCEGDCGRHWCDWEFERDLRELLDAEKGQQ